MHSGLAQPILRVSELAQAKALHALETRRLKLALDEITALSLEKFFVDHPALLSVCFEPHRQTTLFGQTSPLDQEQRFHFQVDDDYAGLLVGNDSLVPTAPFFDILAANPSTINIPARSYGSAIHIAQAFMEPEHFAAWLAAKSKAP